MYKNDSLKLLQHLLVDASSLSTLTFVTYNLVSRTASRRNHCRWLQDGASQRQNHNIWPQGRAGQKSYQNHERNSWISIFSRCSRLFMANCDDVAPDTAPQRREWWLPLALMAEIRTQLWSDRRRQESQLPSASRDGKNCGEIAIHRLHHLVDLGFWMIWV